MFSEIVLSGTDKELSISKDITKSSCQLLRLSILLLWGLQANLMVKINLKIITNTCFVFYILDNIEGSCQRNVVFAFINI